MDIGKLKNNKEFSEWEHMYETEMGYIYDSEIILLLKENPEFNIHIWEAFFDDIFDKPPLNGIEWRGFTRDRNEYIGVFSKKSGNKMEIQNLEEYFVDLLEHNEKEFDFAETRDVFNLMVDFLRYAIATGQTVVVQVV